MHHRVDFLTVTDCRLPGGTASSSAEEINAQARFGVRSGLLHVDTPLVGRTRPVNPRLQRQLVLGHADLVLPTDEVDCDVVVIRNPKTATSLLTAPTARVRAKRCLVVINHVPVSDQGVHYTAAETNEAVRRWLGIEPEWVPIGPLVRQAFTDAEPDQGLMPSDWVNVIDIDEWSVPRSAPRDGTLRVGRHSRDHYVKFPESREMLLRAYPESERIEIRMLGGVPQVTTILGGRIPSNWSLLPFGSMDARRFLSGLDIYSYFHRADLVEAFGRNMLEAMASGLPVVTHPHFSVLFGDAITTCAPDEAAEVYHRLASDDVAYRRMSQLGQEAARDLFGYERHRDRMAELLGRPLGESPSAVAHAPVSISAPHRSDAMDTPQASSILFISPNGAGLGHLTRLMAVARRAAPECRVAFLTFSSAADVVHEQGFDVHYVASRSVTGSTSSGWHAALAERLDDLIAEVGPDVVVIDSTEPYRGLLYSLARHPEVAVVWSRRGMWRHGVSNAVFEHGSEFFDMIVEPSDVAVEADAGVTADAPNTVRVDPVTFLRPEEFDDRSVARDELGIGQDEFAVLVQLGAGAINDTSSAIYGACIAAGRHDGARIFVVSSRLADVAIGEGLDITLIDVYPVSRLMRAFDMAVVAPGYNTVHEVVLAGVPAVYVPNSATITDDQLGRARWLDEQGLGVLAEGETAVYVEKAVERLLDDDLRRGMADRLGGVGWDDGAEQMFEAIGHVVDVGDPSTRLERRRLAVDAVEMAIVVRSRRRRARRAAKMNRTEPSGGPLRRVVRKARRRGRERFSRLKYSVRNRLGAQRILAAYTLLPTRLRRVAIRYASVSSVVSPRDESLLRVPPGVILGSVDETLIRRVLVIIAPGCRNSEIVDEVARVQGVYRNFAPVFATPSLDAAALRTFGYVWEHIPVGEDRRLTATFRQGRLEQIIRWYQPAIVVEVRSVEDVSSPDSMLQVWLRSSGRPAARI